MNRREKDVLLALAEQGYDSQRELATRCDCSLGAVNAAVKHLLFENYVDTKMRLTQKSLDLLAASAPCRAVLLAAGANAAPVFDRTPRALLKVEGEPLIERLIRQLQEVGITDICVVIGFQKERFEYLIDRFGVSLTVNPHYAHRHNLSSMAMVAHRLDNAYVVPADLWFQENPFRRRELYSWYMVADRMTAVSSVRVNRKQELAVVSAGAEGNAMVGVGYLMPAEASVVRTRLSEMAGDRRYEGAFWEAALYEGDKFLTEARVVSAEQVIEAHDREELHFRHFSKRRIAILAEMMQVSPEEITQVTPIKNGVNNRTYVFVCRAKRYVARFPRLEAKTAPDRRGEESVYRALVGEVSADTVIAFDPDTGIKITPYIVHNRICDIQREEDVRECMALLRRLHKKGRSVPHTFDLFAEIRRFEGLRQGAFSVYADYEQTEEQVLALHAYIENCPKEWTLTHIDPVPDNFLITDGGEVHLIDWEYAAMQDPHLDVAMFCLYALYDRQQVEQTIEAYFPEGCNRETRIKLYCYIAAGGLLWSNWCEYQQQEGAEFGEYSLRQYRYAKEYARLAHKELEQIKEKELCRK